MPAEEEAEATARAMQKQLEILEARFDRMYQARDAILRALQGQEPREEWRHDGERREVDREEVLSRCRDEALMVIEQELSGIEAELFDREWELSPETLRLRSLKGRLERLEREVKAKGSFAATR